MTEKGGPSAPSGEHGSIAAAASDSMSGRGSPPKGAPWGEPLVAFDKVWTRFEIWIAMLAFALEAFSMTLWVGLKGFSAPPDHPSAIVFRAVVGAVVLGTSAWWALAKQRMPIRRGATVGAVFVGFLLARTWATFGSSYASNILNWYQQASCLTLLGGLRGVGTRLTMLLALVGGSLATGRGRHIVIDILTRFVSWKQRRAMALAGWAMSAAVCFTAAWGFFDHISIENFGANAEDGPGKKIAQVASQMGEDWFIVRKQIALDVKSVPHVLLRGQTYSDWLTGKEWNAWLDDNGFVERYGKEATDGIRIPDDETRAPLVVIPGRGEPRGELISAAYLVFPIGLTIIALRFILRGLLVLSGHANVEGEESEDWNEHARPGEEPIREYD
jgi:TRAP-type C4-dicarboxylate transport system permease small subunit